MDDDDLRLLGVARPVLSDPLRLLWLSVLAASVSDARAALGLTAGYRWSQLDAMKGLRWVLDDGAHRQSFGWVCDLVDLDRSAIRCRLFRDAGVTAAQALQVAYGQAQPAG